MSTPADHAALALRWRKMRSDHERMRLQVRDVIRDLHAAGTPTKTLAKVFGYRRDQVYRIVTGRKRRERQR